MMAIYLPSIFGALSFLSSVTALLTSSGVSFAVVSRPARLVTAVCAPFVPDLVAVLHICARCGDIAHQLILRRTGGRAQLLRRTQNHVVNGVQLQLVGHGHIRAVLRDGRVTALWPNFWPSE